MKTLAAVTIAVSLDILPGLVCAQVALPRTGTLNNAQPVFCVNPTTAAVEDCVSSSGGGGGGNVTVIGPLGAGADSTGVTVTLATSAITDLGNISTNTGNVASAVTSGVLQDNVKQVNGVTTLTGAGATGTGSQRETVAQDTTTIAGSAPGTAGTPSTNVVSVQGVSSGTNLPVSQATAANLNATVVGTGTFAAQAQPTPVTSGGLSWFFLQPTASDNHANIKNGAGQVYEIAATNNSATVNYLRLYNAATGFNGCNSASNLIGQWAIPASTSGAGIVIPIDMGIAFSTGISICVTSGYATTDVTNATASAMSVSVGYK